MTDLKDECIQCEKCKRIIKINGSFFCEDDETLFGYPRWNQINADGTQTTFSYDSDEDEYNTCYSCKLNEWFKGNFESVFHDGNIPITKDILDNAEKTFNLTLDSSSSRKEIKIRDYISHIYEKYIEEQEQTKKNQTYE